MTRSRTWELLEELMESIREAQMEENPRMFGPLTNNQGSKDQGPAINLLSPVDRF